MKKLLFIITLSIISLSIFAQDKQDTAKYVTNSNVEKLVDKYSAKLSASITSLAQTLKQPAEHVYKVLVKQQVVNSLALLMLPIGGIVFLIILLLNIGKNGLDKEGDLTKAGIISGISGIILLIFFIGSLCTFSDMLQGFINPEYGAIKEIVEMIK